MSNLVTCICQHCQKPFEETQARINRGRGKYCSKKCSELGRIVPKVEGVCPQCKKTFTYKPSRRQIFCSVRCNSLYREIVLKGNGTNTFDAPVIPDINPEEKAAALADYHCSLPYDLDHLSRAVTPSMMNPFA